MAKVSVPVQTLQSLSREVADLSEAAARHVVALDSRGGYPTSGTVWEAGYIVTADHVLRREDDIHVVSSDGNARSASLAGRDPSTDLALLRVDGLEEAFPSRLEAGLLRPGSLAVALSRNSEQSLNASLAVINAIGGEWSTRFGGRIENYLRLDVAVYPGFSGGPLVDPSGALIGINSARLSRQSAVAIPVATIGRIVEELKERGYVRRGYLGIASFPIGVSEALRRELGIAENGGLIVVQVEVGSTSEKAGFLQGDILLDLDGTAVQDPEELQTMLASESVGRSMKARLLRGGKLVELEVEVGERPQRRGSWEHGHGRRGHGRHSRHP